MGGKKKGQTSYRKETQTTPHRVPSHPQFPSYYLLFLFIFSATSTIIANLAFQLLSSPNT